MNRAIRASRGRLQSSPSRLLLGILLSGAASCVYVTGPGDSNTNYVRLQSDPGDAVGKGGTYAYDSRNAVLRVASVGSHIVLYVSGDQHWTGVFDTGTGTSLTAGVYSNPTRYPFNSIGKGMSWRGDVTQPCAAITSSFTLENVSYAIAGLVAFDLTFEQFCDGDVAALRGKIHWRADDATLPEGPVVPIPSDLWKPDPRVIPTSGNYVVLSSESGDQIGQGRDWILASPTIGTGTAPDARTHVTVRGGNFFGDFQTMAGPDPMTVGYYGYAGRWPMGNPTRGRLAWFSVDRGCSTVTGWFAVDQITFDYQGLVAIDLRFEQHCDGAAAALHGVVHWTR